jgi:uncharacterized membrane protein
MVLFLKLLVITTGVFFTVDAFWLYFVMNKFFIYKIAHLMTFTQHGVVMNYVTALIAYAILAVGLTWFVVMPLVNASYSVIFLNGAFLGLCMYGVYEFTNHATLTGWPLSFLCIDVMWGMMWCGLASVISVWIARYFSLV